MTLELPDDTAPPPMYVTREELIKKNVPIQYRDYCAHLYIEWMECFKKSGFNHCELPKMAWEKCQYDDAIRRVHIKQKVDLLKKEKLNREESQ